MNIFQKAELKDIREQDLKQLLDWRNQESIRKVMINSDIILMEEHFKWFYRLQQSKTSISKMFFYNNVPFGVLNVNKIDPINNNCEWGFYIGPSNAPKGMGTILGFMSLDLIFNELSIRKLSAEVLSTNDKSIVFHQKLGFIQEGFLRKHILKDNKYIDIVLFGLFKEEWNEQSAKIQKKIEGRYL